MGDKEWTKEVERVYWADHNSDISTHEGINVVAVNVLYEMCHHDASPGLAWSDSMDEKAETQ